jgi:hypothetical protein
MLSGRACRIVHMREDPIVQEIRKIREAHAARFNYDLKAICKDLKRKEEDCGHPIVSFPPKRVLRKTGS